MNATWRNNLSVAHKKRCANPVERERLRQLGRHSFKEITGQKFGNWTVLHRDPLTDRHGVKWICRCKCGNLRSLFGQSLRAGNTRTCGCDQKWKTVEGSAVRQLFRRYAYGAKTHHRSWELTLDQFESLILSPCYYTGQPPSAVYIARGGEIVLWNGIDRKDSSKGYTVDNCVPCCAAVNFAKNNVSESAFLQMVRDIHSWRKL